MVPTAEVLSKVARYLYFPAPTCIVILLSLSLVLGGLHVSHLATQVFTVYICVNVYFEFSMEEIYI